MAKKIKPGTPHPTKKGLVMGKNGRYVAKGTYAKQVAAAKAAQASSKKGGAIVKAGSSAITKSNSKGGGLARTGGSQKALPGSNAKALPPGKPGGALRIAKGAGRGILGRVGTVAAMAAEIKAIRDRAKRDAERNKKLNRRPFEEFRADSRSGNPKRTGQGSRKPAQKPKPKATDKEIAALTQKGGLFYQGPGKPKPAGTKPVNNNKGGNGGGGGGKPKGGSKPGFQYKAKDTLGKEIEGTKAFIAAHKDKKGAMQNAVKQAMARLKRLQEKQKRGSRVKSAQTKTGNLQISKANRNIG